MNWKAIFTVYPKKRRESLRDRRPLISTIVIPAIAMSVLLFGLGKITSKITTTTSEEDPVVMVGVWPLYGIGPLHFVFVQ